MKRVSVEQAFLWAQRFAAREWRLLLPVILAFLALPPLLVDLLAPQSVRDALVPLAGLDAGHVRVSIAGLLLMVLLLFVSLAGQLAVVALALVPRISVREAIALACARLGILIAAGLLMLCFVLVVALIGATLLSVSHADLRTQQSALVGMILGLMLVLWIRLAMLGPVIVSRAIGPVAALRQAWDMSKGAFWRLFGGIAVYTVGASVVVFALSSALGTMVTLGAKMAGQPELGVALAAVLLRVTVAIGSAGLQFVLVGFYRQLAGSSTGI